MLDIIDSYIHRERCRHFVRQIIVNREGRQIPIILLHDALGSVEQWKDFPRKLALACERNIVILERQGHGKSSPFSTQSIHKVLKHEALLKSKLRKYYGSNMLGICRILLRVIYWSIR